MENLYYQNESIVERKSYRRVTFPLLFTLIFFLYSNLFAQKENNQWILGDYGDKHSLVDFNNGSPTSDSIISTLSFFLTNASICDTAGQMLFYTNGHVIYNRNNDSLLNTSGINPGWATDYYSPYGMGIPQGAFIIPRPGHFGQYLVFYVSSEHVVLDNISCDEPVNLSYSIIDMSLDSGLGGIVNGSKNLIAIPDTLINGRITGVKHANGRDWWVVVHHYNDDGYYTLLVTPDTILGPFIQNIGTLHLFERYIMQSAFSPQGDKFVIGLTVNLQLLQNRVDLLDFDRCTGLFSNHRAINIPDTILLATGCSFSPNGRWLYVNTNANIYQYDTWNTTNINSTRLIIATWDTTILPYRDFFHQLLGPDGKIYVSNAKSENFLHYISEPDSQGLASNIILAGILLDNLNCFDMPNAPNYALGALIGSGCDTITSVKSNSVFDLRFTAFPNPIINNSIITFNYQLPQNKAGTLKVFDLNGRQIFKKSLSQWSSIYREKLALASGLYFAKIESDNMESTIKFIVVE